MDMEYIRNKITELRIQRDLSEYQLSYDLGHSKNYVHNIVTGHSQPSVKELLYLIEILGVSPRDFFDEAQEICNPIVVKKILDCIKDMPDQDLAAVLTVAERLKNKQS